ncbi:hypothetical protein [Moorena bouillonii]|uniref:hypothetical protein n=1 Tax=Moorena bouillonii TaxID=207920 RepID=UPI0013013594|nr:hypothetical protein [Moorena bouillonii]
MPTNAVCKLHDLSAALPTLHELGIVTGKMPVTIPTPDSRLPTPINLDCQIKYSKMARS